MNRTSEYMRHWVTAVSSSVHNNKGRDPDIDKSPGYLAGIKAFESAARDGEIAEIRSNLITTLHAASSEDCKSTEDAATLAVDFLLNRLLAEDGSLLDSLRLFCNPSASE